MVTPPDCPQQNKDPRKLIREGSSQDQRRSAALDPAYTPVDGRTPAHGMVFAESYAASLKYFSATNQAAGDWTPFFSEDLSVRLAAVAIEDVDAYKLRIKFSADFLNDHDKQLASEELKDHLGFLYGSLGTLARQLDLLKEGLPVEIALKGILQNLIRSQLAPAFTRLIAYYKAGLGLTLVNALQPSPQPLVVLRAPVVDLSTVLSAGLSADWSRGAEWPAFVDAVAEEATVYGDPAASVFVRINHCATHGLFKSVFDQFLKVFARTVSEAKSALNETLTGWDRHEPHYALFLSFLRLLELVRVDINTLTGRHLDFYYRQILLLKEKAAEPGHVHLLVELARQVSSHELQAGQLFKAGKDDAGRDAFFASDRGLVVNRAKLAALKTVYRHGPEEVAAQPSVDHEGRLFASPMADSNDGLGAPLASVGASWHPFFNKIYADGQLKEIRMPTAEVGFAIASHYLLLAGGRRTITLDFTLANALAAFSGQAGDVICLLTTAKGWLEVPLTNFKREEGSKLRLLAELSGEFPAITPYVGKIHGYGFASTLPMLLVRLRHSERAYLYSQMQALILTQIDLQVDVSELQTLAVSNDFGPVDTAKPCQPFGASPVAGSSLIVGSVEAFQKKLSDVSLQVEWLATPVVFPDDNPLPEVAISFLNGGAWTDSGIAEVEVGAGHFSLADNVDLAIIDAPNFAADEFYGTTSRHGFAKLALSGGFGQDAYQAALISYLRATAAAAAAADVDADAPPKPPVGPTMSHLSMSYTARTSLMVAAAAQPDLAQFFHLTPFGHAEKDPTASGPVYLLPRFTFQYDNQTELSEAEFYIGVQGLAPPQNLALLFQVADGTANPLVKKPERSPLVFWSYLSNNEWIAFAEDEVQDGSGELLNSGVVSFALPRQATDSNTLLPAGLFWIRAAVKEKSDAVCRLRLVAAQALAATFTDHGNSARFAASTLAAETISKLAQPDSAVKSVTQPFPSFGGRAAELPAAFHTRISERLRHKDRAIGLWDYERLVLEAFPEIYKVKCLDHTQYEPSDSGEGIYRELAPGHVTIVTIPELRFNYSHDRLRPYTSLGLLEKIAAFLQKRLSCFARVHVKNPEFEEVFVDFRVRLRAGFDESYYVNQLRQAITAFLSPWAFEGGGSPSFGGRMYKSVLINFVEEQPSVDYVTDFKLFHKTIVDGRAVSTEKDEVMGSKALSVLVSVPPDKHRVAAIKAAAESSTNAGCRCGS